MKIRIHCTVIKSHRSDRVLQLYSRILQLFLTQCIRRKMSDRHTRIPLENVIAVRKDKLHLSTVNKRLRTEFFAFDKLLNDVRIRS